MASYKVMVPAFAGIPEAQPVYPFRCLSGLLPYLP